MPRITSIEPQKKRQKRFNLYIDHDFYCGLDLEVIMKQGLKKDQELSDEQLEKLKLQDEEVQAHEAALRLLEVRPRSRRELEIRLRQKQKYSVEIIFSVLDRLEDSGLLDDEAFARMFIRDKSVGGSIGKKRLQTMLYEKGIASEIIQVALNEEIEDDEHQTCEAEAIRKMASYKRLAPEVGKRRLTAYLIRRGFASEDVFPVVNQLFQEIEEDCLD